MPLITGLDIPPGLEDAYWAIMQFADGTTQNKVVAKNSTPTRHRRNLLYVKSLFVKWQSLYDSFDSARRASWTVYWESLPFGSHGGANGWPGSGYSAFVYVNAPRYANGLALLLDPPVSNLILNGSFTGNADHWLLAEAFYNDNNVKFPVESYDDNVGFINQDNDSLLDGVQYHVSIDLVVPVGNSVVVSLGDPNFLDQTDNFFTVVGLSNVMTSYSFTIFCRYTPDSGYFGGFYLTAFGMAENETQFILVDNVVVVPT